MTRHLFLVALTLTCLGTVAWTAPSAARGQVPQAIPFQGYLADADGAPLEGEARFVMAFYRGPDDDEPLYRQELSTDLVGGRFTVYVGVGDETPVDLAIFRQEVWVEITVVGPPEETFERFALGTVPHAAAAAYADQCRLLGGMPASEFAPAGHFHRFEELTEVPASLADGVDDDTTYTAGPGLRFSGETELAADFMVAQRRVGMSCPEGEAVRQIGADGTVACQATSYTAVEGGGLVVDDEDRTIGIVEDGVDVDRLSWGVPMQVPFMPISPQDDCDDGNQPGWGRSYGSTNDRDDIYVGVLRYDEANNDDGVRHDYRRARLQVACANAVVEIVGSCEDDARPLASVSCRRNDLPTTATSAEFDPRTGDWYLRIRARPGQSARWAHASVVLY